MSSKTIPPSFMNSFLVLALGLHFVQPVKIVISLPYTILGLIPVSVGLVLNVWSTRILQRGGTTIDFHKTPHRLVKSGPYQFSRNPVYLGGVILSFGEAIILGSLIAFVFPVLMFWILNAVYIPREEKLLEWVFGYEYLDYKQNVRRWI